MPSQHPKLSDVVNAETLSLNQLVSLCKGTGISLGNSRILVKIKAEEQHHRTSLILMNVLNGVERINGLPSAVTYVQDDIHPVSVLLVFN